MSNIELNTVIEFEGSQIKVRGTLNNPFFSALDLSRTFGYVPQYEGKRTKKEDKVEFEEVQGLRDYISYKGVIDFTSKSRKPSAFQFKKWIEEVVSGYKRDYERIMGEENVEGKKEIIEFNLDDDEKKEVQVCEGAMHPSLCEEKQTLPFADIEGARFQILPYKEGSFLFIGKQVATYLEYKDTDDALRKHVKPEDKLSIKEYMDIIRKDFHPRRWAGDGFISELKRFKHWGILITEQGLYDLVLHSTKKEAKRFQHWITHEVLPSIRRTGSYFLNTQREIQPVEQACIEGANQALQDRINQLELLLSETNSKLSEANERISTLTIERDEYKIKHIAHLKKMQYPKLKPYLVFYIVNNLESRFNNRYKIGITDDINKRLRDYRQIAPYTILEYLVYTQRAEKIEKDLKLNIITSHFYPQNHELTYGVPLDRLISMVDSLLNLFCSGGNGFQVCNEINEYNGDIQGLFEIVRQIPKGMPLILN